jgi:hypothetical protein
VTIYIGPTQEYFINVFFNVRLVRQVTRTLESCSSYYVTSSGVLFYSYDVGRGPSLPILCGVFAIPPGHRGSESAALRKLLLRLTVEENIHSIHAQVGREKYKHVCARVCVTEMLDSD